MVLYVLLNTIAFKNVFAEQKTNAYASLTVEEKRLLNMTPEQILKEEISVQAEQKYWEENGATLLSRKGEDPFDTAAAIYIVSKEDIKNGGFTSIPDALRIVPGLQVAQIDGNKWAVAARGFNRQTSSKLRILLDGSPIFTPLFSGVFWEEISIIMDDIERIEVIRGPGDAVWGPNAVNGVINIVTKPAKYTQGNYISTGFGSENKGTLEARYGNSINTQLQYRTYVKYEKQDGAEAKGDIDSDTEWDNKSAGLRVDYQKNEKSALNLYAYLSRSHSNDFANVFPQNEAPFYFIQPFNKKAWNGNIAAKWHNIQSRYSDTTTQLSLNYNRFDVIGLDVANLSANLAFQHNISSYKKHGISWGANFLFNHDWITNSKYLGYYPEKEYNHLYSLFIKDKIAIHPDSFFLTLGANFDHNYYTDFEMQPSVRLTWFPSDNQTVWASLSQATRVPTRFERGGIQNIDGTESGYIGVKGSKYFDSEELIAREVGHRIRLSNNIIIDSTVFYNKYRKLRSGEKQEDKSNNFSSVFEIVNDTKAKSQGFEVALQWQINKKLRLEGGYSFFDIKFKIPKDHFVLDNLGAPKQQYNIQANYKITPKISWNVSGYYVSELEETNIDKYIRLDSNITWQISDQIKASVQGKNLLDDQHQEFSPGVFSIPAEIERSLYTKLTWEF